MPVRVNQNKVQRLNANQWVIIVPRYTVALQKCNKNVEKIPLCGTYLVDINRQCDIKINDLTIQNFINNRIKTTTIILSKINMSLVDRQYPNNFKPLSLDNVNLNNLNILKNNLEIEKSNLNDISNKNIIHNNIGLGTIVLYILIFIVLLYFIWKLYVLKFKQKIVSFELPNTSNSECNPRT